jgi:YbgC/YbaW family acyl-CoA thioester hydrolase
MPAFIHHQPVRFHEVDPAGIVFFARYFQYAHDAQEAWLKQIGYPLEIPIAERDAMLPLVHAEADYHAPLRTGQEMTIELRVVRLGEHSFTLRTKIGSAGGVTHAEIETVHVCVDPETEKSQPLPERLKSAIAAYLDSGGLSSQEGS